MFNECTFSINAAPRMKTQRGAILFFTMAMMFIIVLISVSASESTNYLQKISSFEQDHLLAKENAKRAVLQGEIFIDQLIEKVDPSLTLVSFPTSPNEVVWSKDLADYELKDETNLITGTALEWYEQLEPWWVEYGTEAYGVSAEGVNGRLKSSPRYVLEEYVVEDSGTDLSQSGQYYPEQILVYYRVTARATGDRDARVTLQSTFARTFN